MRDGKETALAERVSAVGVSGVCELVFVFSFLNVWHLCGDGGVRDDVFRPCDDLFCGVAGATVFLPPCRLYFWVQATYPCQLVLPRPGGVFVCEQRVWRLIFWTCEVF